MTVRYLGPTRTLQKPLEGISTLVKGEDYDASQNMSLRRVVGTYPNLFQILPDKAEELSAPVPDQPVVVPPAEEVESPVKGGRFGRKSEAAPSEVTE